MKRKILDHNGKNFKTYINSKENIQKPLFGVGLKSILFENDVNTGQIKSLIEEQVQLYVPDVVIKNEDLDLKRDENKLTITFTYSFRYEKSPQQLEITLQ